MAEECPAAWRLKSCPLQCQMLACLLVCPAAQCPPLFPKEEGGRKRGLCQARVAEDTAYPVVSGPSSLTPHVSQAAGKRTEVPRCSVCWSSCRQCQRARANHDIGLLALAPWLSITPASSLFNERGDRQLSQPTSSAMFHSSGPGNWLARRLPRPCLVIGRRHALAGGYAWTLLQQVAQMLKLALV